MSSSHIQLASNLNNDGVAFLLKGDHNSAVSSITQAIQIMKAQVFQSRAHGSEFAGSTCDMSTTIIEPLVSIQSFGMSSDTAFFNQAIRIPPPTTASYSKAGCNSTVIYTSSIVYNLALVHHIKASTSPNYDDRRRNMIMAEKLYCSAMKLLNDSNYWNESSALVVILACINNLYVIRCDDHVAHENLNRILSRVFQYMRQFPEPSSPWNNLQTEHPAISELLRNCLLFLTTTLDPVAAPAA